MSNLNDAYADYAQKLLDFIDSVPNAFYAVRQVSLILEKAGFIRLEESKKWNLEEGKNYYVTRNSSSLIAFSIPKKDFESFLLCSSHSDSPSFKIKVNPEITAEKVYTLLNIEKYGGMLCAPWFDTPLSVAGRVLVKTKNKDKADFPGLNLKELLVNIDRNLLLIPNLAVHMNRNANDGVKYNVQHDMLPVFSSSKNASLLSLLADELGIAKEEIVSSDLYLYNRVKGSFWGAKNEFISSARLDDLECAFCTLSGFVDSVSSKKNKNCACVYCLFDNEEVGSLTRQGADSTFLFDSLSRINDVLGRTKQDYYVSIAKSFMISADNAHAVHPNFSSCADPVNRPLLNAGPVIKFNAAQKYTSDGVSAAIFEEICKSASIPFQTFTNRSDIAGGSTLGNISNSHVSLRCVDIGLAQWAMHSCYESAGSLDPLYLRRAVEAFYSTTIL